MNINTKKAQKIFELALKVLPEIKAAHSSVKTAKNITLQVKKLELDQKTREKVFGVACALAGVNLIAEDPKSVEEVMAGCWP